MISYCMQLSPVNGKSQGNHVSSSSKHKDFIRLALIYTSAIKINELMYVAVHCSDYVINLLNNL